MSSIDIYDLAGTLYDLPRDRSFQIREVGIPRAAVLMLQKRGLIVKVGMGRYTNIYKINQDATTWRTTNKLKYLINNWNERGIQPRTNSKYISRILKLFLSSYSLNLEEMAEKLQLPPEDILPSLNWLEKHNELIHDHAKWIPKLRYDKDQIRNKEIEQKILAYLSQAEENYFKDIVNAVAPSSNAIVSKALARLAGQGLVTNRSRGKKSVWTIVKTGRSV